MDVHGKKVFVGLSGGVDSAVSAALLKQAGARVMGVFILGWYPPGLHCSWREDREDAMRVAARLHVPFITYDASEVYKKSVIDYLLAEYRAGRTPIPDALCNRDVKFGAFLSYAQGQGADLIATGHYARIEGNGTPRLLRGVDPLKDQSYFLALIGNKALAHVCFPLGGKTKQEVRALAKRFNLPVAEKPDSQGICFLGNISVDEYLKSQFPQTPGALLAESGERIGTHDGALLYTLGERQGLHVESRHTNGRPWYVVSKDIKNNTLTISHERSAVNAPSREIRFRNPSWLSGGRPLGRFSIQYRHRGPLFSGTLSPKHDAVILDEPLLETPAGGQLLVFFREDECYGGAIVY